MIGLQICRMYYENIVRPEMDRSYSRLPYAAALIGAGSEVLGFDDEISKDHDWHPRVLIFLSEETPPSLHQELDHFLKSIQPKTFHGYKTAPKISADLRFRTITTVNTFWHTYLGITADASIDLLDWLTFPQHHLLTLTSGAVYHDGLGTLTAARQRFAFYPHDIWIYMLATQWQKLSDESVFVSRCGHLGDGIGAQIIAIRMIQEVIHLSFLMERRYAPYSKWLGKAFHSLNYSQEIQKHIINLINQGSDADWRDRETALIDLYIATASAFNARRIIDTPIPVVVQPYYERPYSVLNTADFSLALKKTIHDSQIKDLPLILGSINQITSAEGFLCFPELTRKTKALYAQKQRKQV